MKETKEALGGLFSLTEFLWVRLKDGADIGDAVALWQKLSNDEEFKNKLYEAYEGYQHIPSETEEFEMEDVVEIISLTAGFVIKMIKENQ